jgi:dihydroxyacetone kinase-like predicted kinase
VAVIPTRAQVQGLAALAVHEPGRTFQQDVLEMTATASRARHGAVTVAARQAITMAGTCQPGDVLGVVEGDFAVIGDDLYAVATDVLGRLLGGGGELVTLVTGEGAADDLATRCATHVEEHHPHVDVVVYDGGQARYPLLISVE